MGTSLRSAPRSRHHPRPRTDLADSAGLGRLRPGSGTEAPETPAGPRPAIGLPASSASAERGGRGAGILAPMTLQIVNPTAPEPGLIVGSGGLSRLAGSRVGILENGKQHAELLLSSIAEELGSEHGVELVTVAHKRVAAPADPEVIDALVEQADWVLVGSAD